MSRNITVYVCATCGELVPFGCCTCGPRQQLRAIGDKRSKMNETEMIEQALAIALDGFDFARVARYMRRTDWLVENLYDGAEFGEHSWLYPGPKWLREYVEQGARSCIIEKGWLGWVGLLGFHVYLATREGKHILFVRFTDTRPIIVTGHQEVKGARCVEPHNPWRELWVEWLDSRGEPWGDTEGDRHGNRWCFFCDNPDDHFPDCVYLKAKQLLDKEVK